MPTTKTKTKAPARRPSKQVVKWNARPEKERLAVVAEAEAAVVKLAQAMFGRHGRGWAEVSVVITTLPGGSPDFVLGFPTPASPALDRG